MPLGPLPQGTIYLFWAHLLDVELNCSRRKEEEKKEGLNRLEISILPAPRTGYEQSPLDLSDVQINKPAFPSMSLDSERLILINHIYDEKI